MSDKFTVEESIKHCIEKNGFPSKKVRLPFKAIHENCKKYDTSIKDVLANLLQEKIIGIITGDFIEFKSNDKNFQKTKPMDEENHSSSMKPPEMESLKEMALQYMSKMDPGEVNKLKQTVDNMSDEEKENLLKNFSEKIFKNKP